MNAVNSKWNVALIGECMIELQTTPAGHISQTFGGDTFNTAAYLARLGAAHNVRVEYVSAVGDDRFSELMLEFWKAEGVGASLTRSLPGRLPGLYYIDLTPEGERVFSYWRGEAAARDCFSAPGAELIREKLGRFDAVYLSGISLGILREDGRERLLCRLQELRAQGVRIFFDSNFRPRLWGPSVRAALKEAKPWYTAMLRLCHTLFLSAEEVPAFGFSIKTDGAKLVEKLSVLGPEEVLIKNGGGDCLLSYGKTATSIPPERLSHVVDTTAAGDSFAAAYMMGRHLKLEPEDAVRKAHKLAAAVVSHRGAIIPREAMPDLF